MPHHKDTDVRHIKIGDIVDLSQLNQGDLAFALTNSHHGKVLADGILYLKISLVEKKGYRGVNDENTYHLARKDIADLKNVSGKRASIAGISDKYVLRLEYKVREYKFGNEKIGPNGNILFAMYAHAFTTEFGAKALEIVNRRGLKERGLDLEPPPYDYNPGNYKRKPPETVAQQRQPSKKSVLDISLDDAHHLEFFANEKVYDVLKLARIGRLSHAKRLADNDDPDLTAAWKKATKGRQNFSTFKAEIIEAFAEFNAHMLDDRREELESRGIKLDYPPLKLQ